MASIKRAVLAGVCVCLGAALSLGTGARAQEPRRLDVPDYKWIDPEMPRTLSTPVCPSDGLVAFTVWGASHASQGGAILLGYPTTYTNVGGGWVNGGGTFIAPCAGLYSFTASLVKDPFTSNGTTDDVYVYIAHNGVYRGYAFAGQTSPTKARVTGVYTLAIVLNPGDYIQTFVGSDGGALRSVSRYNFTGYLVRPLSPNTSASTPNR